MPDEQNSDTIDKLRELERTLHRYSPYGQRNPWGSHYCYLEWGDDAWVWIEYDEEIELGITDEAALVAFATLVAQRIKDLEF